jgi:hypothetical protein
MHQEHQRLMDGLSDEQKASVENHERLMKQECERMEAQFREMERELAGANPDRKRVAAQAREVERAMIEWQKQHRAVSGVLGAKP